MSWFSTNYEKALLGGAAVIAIGFAFAGWSKFGSVDELFDYSPKGPGRDSNPAVIGAEEVPKAMQSLELDRTWTEAKDPSGRSVDLFTGVALFLKREEPNKPIDLIKGSDVHPGIPNRWWLENHLDPGFADAPERDADKDGFTNREEYVARTDPNEMTSHPPLITKLRFVREESLTWRLTPKYFTPGKDGEKGKLPIDYVDSEGRKNKAGFADQVVEGETFFNSGVAENRFQLMGHVERQVKNPSTNIEMEVTFVRIKDLKPNKGGKIYEIPAPLKSRDFKDHLHYDRSAVLLLDAVGMEGQEWTVEENTRFGLPKDAPNKAYLLKEVAADSIEIEYPTEDGGKQTIRIPKGS